MPAYTHRPLFDRSAVHRGRCATIPTTALAVVTPADTRRSYVPASSRSTTGTPAAKAEPAKRKRNQHRRRTEIMNAAAQVFYELGYEAASTKDVADAVGLLKGSLYYYIDSKEDFLFEVVHQIHQGALALVDDVRQVEGTPTERLRTLIERHVAYHTENLVKTVVFFREFRHLSLERQNVINAEGDAYLDFARQLIDEGKKDGSFRADIDSRIASRGVVGMLNSLHLWYQPNGRLSPRKIADEFSKTLLDGLATPSRKR
jgi:AcrR family transcriptional regulator